MAAGRARATLVLVAAFLTAGGPRVARATTATDICGPAADPCRVNRSVTITPGSVLDFGSRRLEIGNRGALDLQNGTMTIRASQVTVESGGALVARGGQQNPGGTILVMADVITANGDIDASGAPGGSVSLAATGAVTLGGPLQVRSVGSENGGGSVELRGADVTINTGSRINALGGGEDFGGDVDIVATGAVLINAQVDASGGEGGTINVIAGGTVRVGTDILVKADATASAGSGGEIGIDADGVLTIDGQLSANGRNGSADTGAGDGGSIDLTGAAIVMARTAARVSALGGSPDGVGGEIDLSTTSGAIDCQAKLEAQSAGVDGSGGGISVDAIGATTIGGNADVTGGRDGGGEIQVLAGGDILVAATATLRADATSSGNGGDIDIDASANATIRGTLISDGGPSEGANGGANTVAGCTVRIESTGRLSSIRTNGTNTLIGRDSTVVLGTLRADPGVGRNIFRFPGPEYDPAILPGASIQPAGTFLIDTSVVPCNPVVTRTPTATPTVRITPSRTATRTPTARTPTPTRTPHTDCVGDCNGSGDVSVSELITGVNILLGNRPVSACPAFDSNSSGTVTVSELIQGVNNALGGCA